MTQHNTDDTPERVQSLADIGIEAHCVIIADGRLPKTVLNELPDALLVEAGETLKTFTAIEALATKVLRRRSSRPMTLVAVGGGSIGDAVAFLASILWRGVGLWHIPTTLLAMADSAHGGKTALNLGEAKNQLGTFYPADRTIIVEQLVSMLPHELRKEGMAEILKMLWIGAADVVRSLTPETVERCVFASGAEAANDILPLLEIAVRVKLDIIRQDPREEKGIRTVLNLGHTAGHALEHTTGLRHGNAVAWGLAAALRFSEEAGLHADDCLLLWEQLYPLLLPVPGVPDRQKLHKAVELDKKHIGDKLHSVVLQRIGQPVVSTSISSVEWIDALYAVYNEFVNTPIVLRQTVRRDIKITVEAGKSEMNRALILAAQRMGETRIVGSSNADDVRFMLAALRNLGYPVETVDNGYSVNNRNRRVELPLTREVRHIDAGAGGTTFRFLTALCCTSLQPTKIRAERRLLERPHHALLRSLRSAGADIQHFDDSSGCGIVVTGWSEQPDMFSVEADQSSQYASAIALLAAGLEHPFTLRLLSPPISASYLEMTLSMLRTAGVDIIAHGRLIAFNQTERLNEALTFHIEEDASSAAVWRAAAAIGYPLHLAQPRTDSLQPDTTIDSILSRMKDAGTEETVVDLTLSPDLLPVLVATAIRMRRKLRFTGLSTLQHKESDRLIGYSEALAALGAKIHVAGNELIVDGTASFIRNGSRMRTYGDHRSVMAASLLVDEEIDLIIEHPWCVTKSYPTFWNDARRAGLSVRPLRKGRAE